MSKRLNVGDAVTVTTGTYRGMAGTIVGKTGAIYTVKLGVSSGNAVVYLPSSSLRRAS